jgi:hypothetical protein
MNLQLLIYTEQMVLSKNTLLSLKGDSGRKILDDYDGRINFLLCPLCFWCASCLHSQMLGTMTVAKDSDSMVKCPSCTEGNIESIPIAEIEEYKFDYDIKRGVTMEFFR